jgi:subtilase family serine protease
MCDHRTRHHCLGAWLLPEDWRPGSPIPEHSAPDLGTGAGLGPDDIAAAYNLSASVHANGRIVAILDAPDSHALADLATYRSAWGLPAIGECAGMPTGSGPPCFARINEDGTPSTGTDPTPVNDNETDLDMDMVSAACPDCSILLVEINPNFCETDFVAGARTAAMLGASAISISLGGTELTDPNSAPIDPGLDPCGTLAYDIPGGYSSPGHLVFAAAGDFAYDNADLGASPTAGGASPSYPSSSPYVIAVGGTGLYATTAAGSTSYGEGVWNDGLFGIEGPTSGGQYQDVTTSGCSTEFAMPPWQAPALAGTRCANRATADVAAAATFFLNGKEVGIAAAISGGFAAAEGTSASTPIVAAIFTRLGLTTEASNDLGWIYANSSAFNDVGSTGYPVPSGAPTMDAPPGLSCGVLCTIGAGWDGPSGVGSPNGAKLAALPVSTEGPQPYPDAGVSIVVEDGGSGTQIHAAVPADAGADGGRRGGSSSAAEGCSTASAPARAASGLPVVPAAWLLLCLAALRRRNPLSTGARS